MPPFLTVSGVFYLLVASPIVFNCLGRGYWNKVIPELYQILRANLLLLTLGMVLILTVIAWLDLPVAIGLKQLDLLVHSYTFWDFICSCAEGGFVASLLFTTFMLATHFQARHLAETCLISMMSSIFAGLINALLKLVLNRQRPALGLEPWNFFEFFKSGGTHYTDLLYAYNSMPSGHTISTCAALTPLWLAYPRLRIYLVIWGIMVGFSRIYTINHWLSDVLLAAALGVLIGLAMWRSNRWRIRG